MGSLGDRFKKFAGRTRYVSFGRTQAETPWYDWDLSRSPGMTGPRIIAPHSPWRPSPGLACSPR